MGDCSFGADITQWEYISYCLSQLAFTEKGMKKLMESFKTYEHALSEESVMDHFKNIINKALIYLIFMYHLIQNIQDMFSIYANSFFWGVWGNRARSLQNQNWNRALRSLRINLINFTWKRRSKRWLQEMPKFISRDLVARKVYQYLGTMEKIVQNLILKVTSIGFCYVLMLISYTFFFLHDADGTLV